jgi:cytochrome b
MAKRILVWDAPTRVFHWLQALSFTAAYLTAYSERLRNYHVALGYILLGLLAFRLLWGVVGTRYARFSSFLFTPRQTIRYVLMMAKHRPLRYLGHNPAGSVSVWLLLGLGIAVSVTGVMALQDDAGDLVVDLHALATNAMLAVVTLHLVGVLTSSVLHHENLVRAMLTGFKSTEGAGGIRRAHNWVGIAIICAVVAFWFAYVKRPLG